MNTSTKKISYADMYVYLPPPIGQRSRERKHFESAEYISGYQKKTQDTVVKDEYNK